MIRGLHHTAISTPDIDRLVRFYRDVIGFRVAWEI
jgi:catechol 2,3-dioxygenase-like lactoylglutathione lyase family enzyme